MENTVKDYKIDKDRQLTLFQFEEIGLDSDLNNLKHGLIRGLGQSPIMSAASRAKAKKLVHSLKNDHENQSICTIFKQEQRVL